ARLTATGAGQAVLPLGLPGNVAGAVIVHDRDAGVGLTGLAQALVGVIDVVAAKVVVLGRTTRRCVAAVATHVGGLAPAVAVHGGGDAFGFHAVLREIRGWLVPCVIARRGRLAAGIGVEGLEPA